MEEAAELKASNRVEAECNPKAKEVKAEEVEVGAGV